MTEDQKPQATDGEYVVRPAVDAFENDRQFLLYVDMPGVSKQSLELHLEKGQLTLEGTRPERRRGKQRIPALHYRRVFNMPEGVKIDHCDAELAHGVLKLELPKVEAQQPPPRKIPIRTV